MTETPIEASSNHALHTSDDDSSSRGLTPMQTPRGSTSKNRSTSFALTRFPSERKSLATIHRVPSNVGSSPEVDVSPMNPFAARVKAATRRRSLVDDVEQALHDVLAKEHHFQRRPSHATTTDRRRSRASVVMPVDGSPDESPTHSTQRGSVGFHFAACNLPSDMNDSIFNSALDVRVDVDDKQDDKLQSSARRRSISLDEKRDSVRNRKVSLFRFQAFEREVELKRQKERTEAAAARRRFLEEHRKIQRTCTWLAATTLMVSFSRIWQTVKANRLAEATRRIVLPAVLIGLRRMLRRARTRMYGGGIQKPTVEQMKLDKIFALYSDAHMQSAIDRLRLKYVFPNEMIIFMGMEEDEAYFLHSGSADVLMGTTKIFTMRPGMWFGTVGMISGELRTASIVAREACFLWVINRTDFESCGRGDHQVTAALQTVQELRQKNFRNVYRVQLEPASLRKFATLRGVSDEFLESLSRLGITRVVKANALLVDPFRPGDSSHVYVLRGKLRIVLPTPSNDFESNTATALPRLDRPLDMAEQLAKVIDLPSRTTTKQVGDVVTHVSVFRVMADAFFEVRGGPNGAPQTKRGEQIIAEIGGPALVNLATLVTTENTPFRIETVTGCDMIEFPRDVVSHQDVLELSIMRQSSYNLAVDLLPVINSTQLLHIVFSGNLSFAFLNSLRGGIPLMPTVIVPQDTVRFTPSSGEALIVLRGVLEDTTGHVTSTTDSRLRASSVAAPGGLQQTGAAQKNRSYPYLWPDVHMFFFGSILNEARAETRIECIKFKRSDFLAWITNELGAPELSTLVQALTETFVFRTARKPVFSDLQLVQPASPLGSDGYGAAKPVLLMSCGSQQVQSPTFRTSKLRELKIAALKTVAYHAGKAVHECIAPEVASTGAIDAVKSMQPPLLTPEAPPGGDAHHHPSGATRHGQSNGGSKQTDILSASVRGDSGGSGRGAVVIHEPTRSSENAKRSPPRSPRGAEAIDFVPRSFIELERLLFRQKADEIQYKVRQRQRAERAERMAEFERREAARLEELSSPTGPAPRSRRHHRRCDGEDNVHRKGHEGVIPLSLQPNKPKQQLEHTASVPQQFDEIGLLYNELNPRGVPKLYWKYRERFEALPSPHLNSPAAKQSGNVSIRPTPVKPSSARLPHCRTAPLTNQAQKMLTMMDEQSDRIVPRKPTASQLITSTTRPATARIPSQAIDVDALRIKLKKHLAGLTQ